MKSRAFLRSHERLPIQMNKVAERVFVYKKKLLLSFQPSNIKEVSGHVKWVSKL